MKTYNIGGSEFTQKDFRKTGNRKTYYNQYADLISSVYKDETTNINLLAMRFTLYISDKVYTKNEQGEEVTGFVEFLQPFIEGDFNKIAELQSKDEEQGNLMQFCVEVVRDFFLLNLNGEEN